MAKEKVSYNYLMRMASKYYLTNICQDWHTWNSKKADTFVKEHAWSLLNTMMLKRLA